MAYYDQVFYVNAGNQSTTGYYAVALRPQNAAVTAGQLVRQFTAPAVNSERVFVCVIAGTTANTTDATWVLTRGAKTVDGTATWMEVTGIAALNSDITNTINWTAAKAIGAPSLGTVIQRNNGASFQICTTAGAQGASEPAFSDTAGVTTTDSSAVWTSLGVVGNWTAKGAAPHARLFSAFASTWFASGNTIFVGDNHAESQAATLAIAMATLTQGPMGRVICHNHSGSYPPTSSDLRTTATISTTGATSLGLQANSGSLYFYGLTFNAGTSGNFVNLTFTPQNSFFYFDACVFKIGTAGTNACSINLTTATNVSGAVVWNNCQVSFAAAAQYISFTSGNFIWQNTGQVLASGSTVPTFLIETTLNYLADIILEALDLSQVTAVFAVPAATFSIGNWVIKDCKLNASVTFPTLLNPNQVFQSIRADGGATAYKSARYTFDGTETTETSITRVGGASDPTGQAQSRKIVTTANSQWLRPFKAEPYAIWNPRTAANVTVTVCGTINAGALPNNDDIWMDVEYLGSSSFPIGTIVNTTKANLLAANAAVAADGSTWNGTTAAAVTWDTATTSNVTLSGGNLVVTSVGTSIGGAHVAAGSGLTSGKYYFEVTVTTYVSGGSTSIGIGDPASTYSGMGSTGGVTGDVVYFSGNIYTAAANPATLSPFTASGAVVAVAVDLDNRKIWFRRFFSGAWGSWNATTGTANDPAANTGGVTIPAGTMVPFVTFNGNGTVFTANFGASGFVGAVPSGFTAGWIGAGGGTWSPFKLTTTLSSPQPGMAGYIHVRPKIAKPSSTFYLDPQITLS